MPWGVFDTDDCVQVPVWVVKKKRKEEMKLEGIVEGVLLKYPDTSDEEILKTIRYLLGVLEKPASIKNVYEWAKRLYKYEEAGV